MLKKLIKNRFKRFLIRVILYSILITLGGFLLVIGVAEQEAKEAAAIFTDEADVQQGGVYNDRDYQSDIHIIGNGELSWPCQGDITDEFGMRICPFHGRELHGGLDIAVETGTPIRAAHDGTVILSEYSGGYGFLIKIKKGNVETVYGHNSKLLARVGEKVKKGQMIARAGSSGDSTGPHCHFEVKIDGQLVDPRLFLTEVKK